LVQRIGRIDGILKSFYGTGLNSSGPVASAFRSSKSARKRMRGPYPGVITRLFLPIHSKPAITAASFKKIPPFSTIFSVSSELEIVLMALSFHL
jgi:hypothetical protein